MTNLPEECLTLQYLRPALKNAIEILHNGWAGYDPYDIRGQAWFIRMFGADL